MKKLKTWVKVVLGLLIFSLGIVFGWIIKPDQALASEPVVVEKPIYIYEEVPIEIIKEVEIVKEVSAEVQEIQEEPIVEETKEYSDEDFELICAIIRQEGGPEYNSALAVISSAVNRLKSPKWTWCGDTVLEQLTHEGQYCYSLDNYWQRYLGGNVEDTVKQAVSDGLAGITNHNYTCFRGYYVEGGYNIGGNYYFGD